MVKFGKHQQVFLDNLGAANLYTVPYDEFKYTYIPAKAGEDRDEDQKGLSPAAIEDLFIEKWRECLEAATGDFNRAVEELWHAVFTAIDHLPESRGAVPDQALRLYMSTLSKDKVSELHLHLKQIHGAALLNSEALRKLVKKFDKQLTAETPSQNSTSARLLPMVYSSSFCVGLPTLENGLTLIRQFLGFDGEDADEEAAKHLEETRRRVRNLNIDWTNVDFTDQDTLDGGFLPLKKRDSDAMLIEKRNSELRWLRSFVKEFPPSLIGKLVGHRGFHSVHDRSDRRPIENSQIAYEACWTNGIHLCECDIALTLDERIILAHDDNFTRLALDPTDELCQKKVKELTYREIISLPLKSGVRPPLLFDVLRSAYAIGEHARMIVEIKPGNVEAGTALAKMFARHPDLMARCAVVMSFDAFAMHQFRKELTHVMDYLALDRPDVAVGSTGPPQVQHRGSHRRLSSQNLVIPTAMSIGKSLEDIALEAASLPPRAPAHRRIDSTDHFGIGMSIRSPENRIANIHDESQQQEEDSGFGQFHMLSERTGSLAGLAQQTLEPIPADEPANLPLEPGMSNLDVPSGASGLGNMLYRPKLLLITGKACDNPHQECELQVSVKDLSRVDNWLRGGASGPLDGVYLQYEPEMLTDEGSKEMRKLAARYDVGIWGANPKPDDFETFEKLICDCGVSFVNSSLPRKFMEGKH